MHDAGREISLPTSSFLSCPPPPPPDLLLPTTYFSFAGLSYEGRKHTQIRAQLPLAAGSHTTRLFYERPYSTDPGPRISSEIASTSITNSHLARPGAVPPGGGFSARCPPGCYFGSPESDFHFDGFLRISMGTSRTRRKFAHCGPRKSRGQYLGQKELIVRCTNLLVTN